jgi:hypothetical protein
MKITISLLLIITLLISCNGNRQTNLSKSASVSLIGTWKLIRGELIEKGDTTVTDYTKGISFIKIINPDHFAFFEHDLDKGKDSATAVFVAGGGRYSLHDSTYTEHLEYCSARNWEGNDFTFTVHLENDTLTQSGIEKVDSLGVNRLNIETYVRVEN